MDWLIGIATITLIVGGAALFAAAIMRSAAALPNMADTQKTAGAPDYRTIAKRQAESAETRKRPSSDRIMDLWDWVHAAVMHLLSIWPTMSYADALREMKGYLEDEIAAWPSDEHEYSMRSARDSAEEYAREFGEQYGSNS